MDTSQQHVNRRLSAPLAGQFRPRRQAHQAYLHEEWSGSRSLKSAEIWQTATPCMQETHSKKGEAFSD
jgi:hypothetical protein